MRITSNLSTLTQFLPGDLASFLKKNPLINVYLEERVSTAVVSAVEENACDIGMIVEGPKVTGLEYIPYWKDRLVLPVPDDHPLSTSKPVRFADTLEYGYVGLHTGSQINLQMQRAAAELDRAWKCRMQIAPHDAQAAMAASGLGIGVLPCKMAELYSKAFRIKIVELEEDRAERTQAIVTRS